MDGPDFHFRCSRPIIIGILCKHAAVESYSPIRGEMQQNIANLRCEHDHTRDDFPVVGLFMQLLLSFKRFYYFRILPAVTLSLVFCFVLFVL